MDTSNPIRAKEASTIAVGGCFLGAPLVAFGIFKWVLKQAENKEHAMAHQIEEVDIEPRGDASGAHQVPPEESLGRYIVALRRVSAPFEKMGARFEPANYESERKKLDNLKKRFETSGQPASPESQKLLQEAEQILARYAPQ